jgi:DEAD/DEAH box helicase domain-containing protein
MVHPGAIYLHQGNTYQVESLDLEHQKALLVPCREDYYTEAVKEVTFESQYLLGKEEIAGAIKYKGEIQVTSQVIGYKKVNWKRYELLDTINLDLPPTILNSIGFWISLSEETENILRNQGEWNSSVIDYGSNWKKIRQSVLERDQYTCAACKKISPDSGLHVHHKMPMRNFSSLEEAHQLSNLISLCPRCHQRAESVVRVRSGLSGLGYLLHNLAPLLLMCDPGDLGLHTDFTSPLGLGRPTILLYEYVPAGIGFSQFLYQHILVLMQRASHVLNHCACENGCPACVGPGGELGSGGKEETKALLNILCS